METNREDRRRVYIVCSGRYARDEAQWNKLYRHSLTLWQLPCRYCADFACCLLSAPCCMHCVTAQILRCSEEQNSEPTTSTSTKY